MSRVMAAREKRSAAEGLVWVECQVWREGWEGVDGGMVLGEVEVDVVGRVGGGETREVVEAVVDEEVEELEDVIEVVERRALGRLQIALRAFLSVLPRVLSVYPEVEAADEDEDEEKEKEKRVGEPGRPMRMTVPFEAAESGRGKSGDDGGSSLRVDRANRAGFLRRPVRPPDGRSVLLGTVGWMVGAAVRTHRSGAEYWYASRSLTRGGARSESRAWNWPKYMWKPGSMRILDGRMAACARPRAWSHARADARQCGQVIKV